MEWWPDSQHSCCECYHCSHFRSGVDVVFLFLLYTLLDSILCSFYCTEIVIYPVALLCCLIVCFSVFQCVHNSVHNLPYEYDLSSAVTLVT